MINNKKKKEEIKFNKKKGKNKPRVKTIIKNNKYNKKEKMKRLFLKSLKKVLLKIVKPIHN
jgi:hypothetical protein